MYIYRNKKRIVFVNALQETASFIYRKWLIEGVAYRVCNWTHVSSRACPSMHACIHRSKFQMRAHICVAHKINIR